MTGGNTYVASAESYIDFLARVHRQDVEDGVGRHKPGHCATCDSIPDIPVGAPVPPMKVQCSGVTAKGTRCGRHGMSPAADMGVYYCPQHRDQDGAGDDL